MTTRTCKSRFFALSVSLAVLANLLPFAAFGAGNASAGSEQDPITISSSEDLKELAEQVNGGNSFKETYFKFTNDITLPDNWTPLGSGGKSFSGTIDGGGKTLTVPAGSLSLIGKPAGATIKNLDIYGEKIPGYGLIEGYTTSSSAVIDNVTIKSGSHILRSGFVGGYGNASVNISNCTVEKGVIIGDDGSGFWGDLGDTTANYPFVGSFDHRDNIGSFAGAFNGNITNCVSYATVYGKNNVGGIVGMKGQSMREFSVNNCAFYGDIIATGKYVGGIVGSGYISATAASAPCVTIENCHATGNITGSECVGGIFGGEGAASSCWNNGIGRIRNNYFSGTVKAEAAEETPGGIVGSINNLGKYNIIYSNYYTDDCGAETPIGKVGTVNSTEHYGRTDDPLGADLDKLAEKISRADLTNGRLVKLLNTSNVGRSDYQQGEDHPVFGNEKHIVSITSSALCSTSEKSINMDYSPLYKYELTVKYSDGATETVPASEGRFSGVDFSKFGYQIAKVTYKNYTFDFGVRVSEPKDEYVKAYITLLGDVPHEHGVIHTYRDGNLECWVDRQSYLLPVGSTAKDLIDVCLEADGAECVNESGNYISSITRNGTELGEGTNGIYSGWQYKANGESPLVGISEFKLSDNDEIVLYYTDHFLKEDWNISKTAEEVAEMIDELPETDKLTLSDSSKVYKAKAAYDSLSDEDKETFPELEERLLKSAVEKIQQLKKELLGNAEDVYKRVGEALLAKAAQSCTAVSTAGGEWLVLGLARSGLITDEVKQAYLAEVEDIVKENGSPKLHSAKSTENSRVILALTALGADVTNVGGYDLLQPLADFEYVKSQGINGTVWALIALDSHNYEIPAAGEAAVPTTREGLVEEIVNSVHSDGGWGLGEQSEADITAMAIQALAPYYDENEAVKAAVDKALEWLSEEQNEDGTFSSLGTDNCESTAQVITALTSLGIDPAEDERFIKNGSELITVLCGYSTSDGFLHTLGDEISTAISSEQGYYALASYYRLIEGKTALFDMSDVETEISVPPAEENKPSQPEKVPSENAGEQKDPAENTDVNNSGQQQEADKEEVPDTGAEAAGAGLLLISFAGIAAVSMKKRMFGKRR